MTKKERTALRKSIADTLVRTAKDAMWQDIVGDTGSPMPEVVDFWINPRHEGPAVAKECKRVYALLVKALHVRKGMMA